MMADDAQKKQKLPIGPGTRVRLKFSLALEAGGELDSTPKPVEFQVGDGNLLPGFESRLFGLFAGARRLFKLPPEEAFGKHDPKRVQVQPRANFPGMQLEEGLLLGFADPSGGEVPGLVAALSAETVTLDFNHPLAGRTVMFAVEIIDVAPASGEIIRVREPG